MKNFGKLALGSFVLLSLFGFAAIKTWKSESFPQFQEVWKQKFTASQAPSVSIDLTELLQNKKSQELFDLDLSLPHYHRFDTTTLRSLVDSGRTCKHLKLPRLSRELQKLRAWNDIKCGWTEPSAAFFNHPPFVHPSGESYLSLAEKSGLRIPVEIATSRESYRTLLETLQNLGEPGIALSENLSALEFVLAGAPIAAAGKKVFLKQNRSEDQRIYDVYESKSWNDFFQDQDFEFTSETTDSVCLEKLESGCWIANPKTTKMRIRWMQISALAAVFFFLFAAASLYWKHRLLRKREEAQRKFTLEMLTHELRTPVTSLLILLERLRSQFDIWPEQAQRDFLKIADEIRRLKKVVESSTIYLQLKDPAVLTESSFRMEMIEESLTEEESVTLEIENPQLILPEPWQLIEFCLSNLISNSKTHGKQPIRVRVFQQDGDLRIVVQDSGALTDTTLPDLIEPFRKSQRSRGLGLGLHLVHEICRTQKWKLSLDLQPTRFTISIPARKLP